ncbi:MAG: acetoacetate decarboxylase family protein, partial [Cyclobacteriaceae bacterium]
NLNYKVINHINGQPAIRQITSRNLEDVQISECWIDPCSVTLRANMQAPIYKLPVIEEGSACFWKGGFTLVEGEIVHDYLK